ncbi:hypothetical protein ZIOFF_010352 [Zingiber officinale]|uniref:Uncharacterized protein n=1 Tax=Zingiber officinale TaxID=94328 RepID=A0A8J5I475_ZINOF|nr:hypothetical protein ZIOFF_010352 [Zingiber officinale]
MIGRLPNTSNVGFAYEVQGEVEYLTSHGVRALPRRRYSTTHLQGLNWTLRPTQITIPMQPSELNTRNLLDGRISLSFNNYQTATVSQAIHYNEKDEEIQSDEESFQTLAVLIEKAPGIFINKDYPEDEDYLPWPSKTEGTNTYEEYTSWLMSTKWINESTSSSQTSHDLQQKFLKTIEERQETWKKIKDKVLADKASLLGTLKASPTILVTRLSTNAILPTQKSTGVAGFDLAASENMIVPS